MRARLIGMVVALLAVTLGAVAIISTQVAHVEMRKLEVHRIPGTAGTPPRIFVFRDEHDNARRTRSLDRSFFFIFAGATVFGVLMALLVARWISVPVERLTAAARRMEGGDLTVRVEPSGGAELEGLADSFNAMAAAIDRNEEVRRRMVTDVAHELRAPLTNLRCELESIQDGLTEASAERVASLHDEVMHLSALVEDLQDLSLADAGKLEIDAQRVNVAEVVRRAVRGMTVATHGDDDVFVQADPRRVVQILTNLLTNAVVAQWGAGGLAGADRANPAPASRRCSTENEIAIEWEVAGAEVVIRVIDNGIGIAADQLPHIFDRFYRVDPSRARATGGAGLGLSIVKQLVLAHGGRVWAESTPGVGTTVAFTLPS
ncbi:MAG TPA: ATP-binding protein [Thermoanaerobaculia bacterium]|jgi:signal transduction histidine kinase|nr:ATP-binding protein [Thermoanaerobaculia bacterium]